MLVCIGILRPSQPNGVMSSTVNLPNHTITGQAQSSSWLTKFVQILSLEKLYFSKRATASTICVNKKGFESD